MQFETSVPYSPGISHSLLLGSQAALYNGINQTCGQSFLNGNAQAAGGALAGGVLGSGAPHTSPNGVAIVGSLLVLF